MLTAARRSKNDIHNEASQVWSAAASSSLSLLQLLAVTEVKYPAANAGV